MPHEHVFSGAGYVVFGAVKKAMSKKIWMRGMGKDGETKNNFT